MPITQAWAKRGQGRRRRPFGWAKSAPAWLGIDIGASAVKLVELAERDGRMQVENYAIEPLPAGAMADNRVQDGAALTEAIERAVQQAGARARRAATAVPSSAAIARTVTVPAGLSGRELESQIELEAAQCIPYPLAEVHWDFAVQPSPEPRPDTVAVLLAACRSEHVTGRAEALARAGLTPVAVGVEAYAIERAWPWLAEAPPRGKAPTVALLDIEARLTAVHILHGGRLVYTREQDFGGVQIAEEIQRRYRRFCEEAGAGQARELSPEAYTSGVVEPFKEIVTQQIGRAFQLFFSSTRYSELDRIVLAGEYAAIPGVDNRLIEATAGVAVATAHPFAAMALGPRVKAAALDHDAPALVAACGLALRLKAALGRG